MTIWSLFFLMLFLASFILNLFKFIYFKIYFKHCSNFKIYLHHIYIYKQALYNSMCVIYISSLYCHMYCCKLQVCKNTMAVSAGPSYIHSLYNETSNYPSHTHHIPPGSTRGSYMAEGDSTYAEPEADPRKTALHNQNYRGLLGNTEERKGKKSSIQTPSIQAP